MSLSFFGYWLLAPLVAKNSAFYFHSFKFTNIIESDIISIVESLAQSTILSSVSELQAKT